MLLEQELTHFKSIDPCQPACCVSRGWRSRRRSRLAAGAALYGAQLMACSEGKLSVFEGQARIYPQKSISPQAAKKYLCKDLQNLLKIDLSD